MDGDRELKITTIMLDDAAKREGKVLAALQGLSLSAWMRKTIHDQYEKKAGKHNLY
jgi:hypothetical protein